MITSLSSVLNSAIRSMQTSQFGLAVHSENIAHANDPTYTRKKLDPGAEFMTGAPGILRLRDAFIDDQYRLSADGHGQSGMRKEIMSRVEEIFGDPVNGGLGVAINQFFDKWGSLAENPADGVARLEVISAGNVFTQQVKSAYSQLQSLKDRVDEQVADKVNQVNTLLNRVFELNKQIAQLGRNSMPDASLKDQRDSLLDGLARLAGARSSEQPDGSVRVTVGSTVVLDGPVSLQLSMVDGTDGPTPSWIGAASPEYNGGGEIAGLLDVRNSDLTDLMSDLSTLAKTVATEVNNLHGITTGAMDFFTIGGGAVDIEVNRNLGTGDVLPGYDPTAPSDGERARALAALADAPILNSTLLPGQQQSARAFYRNLVGLIGNRASDANTGEEIAKVHLDTADRQRQSEWGISIDEEVASLMTQQRAFQAASRVITATDDMFDYLINRTGR